MGQELTPKFYETLQKHLELGTPLKHVNFSPIQRRRAEVCLDVYHKLEENEMMDQKRYLRQRWGRTDTEIRQDLKVINWLMGELNEDSKELSRYRLKKQGERIIRMGQATGDWKAIEAGSKLIYKIEGFDKPETAIDVEANTHMLPPVFVSIPKNGVVYDEEQLDKLRKKYHAEKDKTQEMVEAKMGLFVPAGSTLDKEEFIAEASDFAVSDELPETGETLEPSDP